MNAKSTVSGLIDDFVSLLFPRSCYACGTHLVRNEEILCTSCKMDIPRTNYHEQTDNELEKAFWGRCEVYKAASFAFYLHGGIMQKLIHNLKYKGAVNIGNWLGKMYGKQLSESGFLDKVDLIIPVPLHPSRKRKRGFNQSRIIADGISSVTGIEVSEKELIRTVRNPSQTSKSRYERWQNVGTIFSVQRSQSIESKTILLVDDVITTGSTIEGCVNSLSSVPGVKVIVVSLATALKG